MTGNLYVCDDFYFFIYETQEKAKEVRTHQRSIDDTLVSVQELAMWRETGLGSKVMFSTPGEPILFLEKGKTTDYGEECWHVLIGEKIGWIVLRPFIEFRNLTNK